MKSFDNLEETVRKDLNFTAGAELHDRMLNDVLNAQDNFRKASSAVARPNLGRTIMKSPLTKLAVAASVIVACVTGVWLWRGTQSGIVLADVLARMEQVKAFRCQFISDVTVEGPNEPESFKTRATHLISQEYGEKGHSELLNPNGTKGTTEGYWLPDKMTMISISHEQKKYWRTEYDANAAEERSNYDPRTQTKRILKFKHENLGRSTIDGIEVEGFQTTDPNFVGRGLKNPQADVKVWVDVETRLPVRYEGLISADFYQNKNKIIWRSHFVIYDFQWDVPVDASEFKPVIPDDYIGVVIKYPEHITEEIAIQGLKLWGELLGNYPEKITNVDGIVLRLAKKSETPAALRLKEEIEGGLTDEEALNKLVDFLMPLRGLERFYELQKDLAYYGKTVPPKDADKVLMRWKLSDSEYRVIYGDLHVETVTKEKLAELEAALPK